jgi:hypothetical protein
VIENGQPQTESLPRWTRVVAYVVAVFLMVAAAYAFVVFAGVITHVVVHGFEFGWRLVG